MTDQPPVNTQAQTGGLLDLPKAPASPRWVLEREPNLYRDATSGPHPQISAVTYVEWTKRDGDKFLAPLSQSELFERKGYRRGADKVITNMRAYLDEQAGLPPMEERTQDTEDAIQRITGVPKTAEELEEERKVLEEERLRNEERLHAPAQPQQETSPFVAPRRPDESEEEYRTRERREREGGLPRPPYESPSSEPPGRTEPDVTGTETLRQGQPGIGEPPGTEQNTNPQFRPNQPTTDPNNPNVPTVTP